MTAYYSEFDPKAAAWLRELIKQGHIADGEVDERDLWDVTPNDLRGFDQVHLCAGIGVWSYSLRRSGWPDDRPVWTASFPCQPFSAAGKGEGFADERHLWPAGEHLIREHRPRILFGEQVASKDAEPWLDLVQADLEALGYAFGACAFPSAGVGAPHIRDRTYWVADAGSARSRRNTGTVSGAQNEGKIEGVGTRDIADEPIADVTDGRLADDDDARLEGRGQPGRERAAERLAGAGGVAGGLAYDDSSGSRTRQRDGTPARHRHPASAAGSLGGMADTDGRQRERVAKFRGVERDGQDAGRSESGREPEPRSDDAGLREPERRLPDGPGAQGEHGLREVAIRPGPVNGEWGTADWLYSRDGFWRPVEPESQPLAHGAPARVGRLRGYGNAINAEAAVAWIKSYLDTHTVEAGA